MKRGEKRRVVASHENMAVFGNNVSILYRAYETNPTRINSLRTTSYYGQTLHLKFFLGCFLLIIYLLSFIPRLLDFNLIQVGRIDRPRVLS